MTQFRNILKPLISSYILFLQLSQTFAEIRIEPRMVRGTDATIDEVPFIVQIWRDEKFFCGGTLASKRHIITAAHCVYDMAPNRFTVVAGASKLNDVGIRAKVAEIILHPSYRDNNYNVDIAVMKLASPISGPVLGLSSICDAPISPGDTLQVFGWGKLYDSATSFSNQLQAITVRVVDHGNCQRIYRHRLQDIFCAFTSGVDTCMGDSGGPALINGKFCGIVKGGYGCAHSTVPGVYTQINNMRILPFLLDVLRQ